LLISWLSGHNLPTTNARRLIKGSQDVDFQFVFFTKKGNNLPLAVGA